MQTGYQNARHVAAARLFAASITFSLTCSGGDLHAYLVVMVVGEEGVGRGATTYLIRRVRPYLLTWALRVGWHGRVGP